MSADSERGCREWVTPAELDALAAIPTGRVVAAIALTWAALVVSIQASLILRSPWATAVAFFVNGFLFVSLSYWEHEACHGLLSRDRRINDLAADLFLAGPFGVSVAQHRWQHARHHLAVNDPEVEVDHTSWICIGGAQLFLQLLLHAVAWHGLATVLRYRGDRAQPRFAGLPGRSRASMVGFVVANGAVFTLTAVQGQWYMYFLVWVLPLFTVAVAAMNLFNIVEHQASRAICEAGLVRMPPITRVVRAGFFERTLLAPVGSYYHLEHHEFPGVPAFRLPELRHLLEVRGRYREPDVIWADGYLRTLWRLSRDPDYGEPLSEQPQRPIAAS